jgi:glycosyltransferase
MYDAMSKGIQRARGSSIGILNADDFLAGPDILATVAEVFQDPDIDSCYGDLVYLTAPTQTTNGHTARIEEVNGAFVLNGERIVRRWKAGQAGPKDFYWGWMPPHPTFFVRRSVYEKLGLFRLDLGTAGDYELMLRFLLKHRITTRYIPKVLVKMRVGGASNASLKKRLAAHRNDRKAWAVNGLKPYPWTLWLKPLRKIGQWL